MELNKDSKVYTLVKKFIGIVKKRIKNVKTKLKVIEEIVETEKSYIKGLDWLVKWKNEILEKEIVKPNDVEVLFSNVLDNIKLISDQILLDFKNSFDVWERDS